MRALGMQASPRSGVLTCHRRARLVEVLRAKQKRLSTTVTSASSTQEKPKKIPKSPKRVIATPKVLNVFNFARDIASRSDTATEKRASKVKEVGETPEDQDIGPSLFLSSGVACLGAFLFGYHSAVINSPLNDLARDLGFPGDLALKGLTVSIMVAGGVFGGLGIGAVADKYGRQFALGATTIPLMLGSVLSAVAPSSSFMLAGRLIAGVGVGASSGLVPLYLSEVAPPRIRGFLGSVRRFAFVIGCLSAFLLVDPLSGGDVGESPEGWWRGLFWFAALPAALQFAGVISGQCEESPSWLMQQGREKESRRALAKLQNIRGREAVAWQRKAIAASATDNKPSSDTKEKSALASMVDGVVMVFEERSRKQVYIGIGLCLLAAFSGSNTVIYYASSVFSELGLTGSGLLTALVGIPNMAGAVFGLVLTDKWGRRPLLLTSFGVMAGSLAILAAATYSMPTVSQEVPALCEGISGGTGGDLFLSVGSGEQFNYMSSICLDMGVPYAPLAVDAIAPTSGNSISTIAACTMVPIYVCAFSAGAGPVPWLLYNEIFPLRVRARATALCTGLNYAANAVVGSTFLPAVQYVGLSGTYATYAVLCLIGYVFTDILVIETKGRSLEEIELELTGGGTK
ncbi:hypothetical protein CYMTET_44980 [Cymbomonas tetramitiformis]|uniref:Major facilitator superfamily (MFS) profile domain-containing protein n=1 Tax=Cymbomonas tetramitiformis TaxID=36881 RepID=A0AAE0BZ47_9CHLO|nr:hypothetical protein CYMTET_44980 [Cymbomonas tetramitiformis]